MRMPTSAPGTVSRVWSARHEEPAGSVGALTVARSRASRSGRPGPATAVQGSRRGAWQGDFNDHGRVPARRVESGAYASCAGNGLRTRRLDRDAAQRSGTRHIDGGPDLL